MIGDQLQLILLPTNKCNVACEYCFEDKTADFMTHDQLALTIEKLLDHLEQQRIGEFLVKDPYCEVYKALFSRVEEIAAEISRARFVRSLPVLQTRSGPVNQEISL